MSKSIVTPLCFIECDLDFLGVVRPKLVTSERRTLNARSVIPYSKQDHVVTLKQRQTLRYTFYSCTVIR
jgi:hypothetical protein